MGKIHHSSKDWDERERKMDDESCGWSRRATGWFEKYDALNERTMKELEGLRSRLGIEEFERIIGHDMLIAFLVKKYAPKGKK